MNNIEKSESRELDVIRRSKSNWRKANDRRGVKYDDLAKQFVKDYPIGSVLKTVDLDIWLQNHGLLIRPPNDTPKDSDAWLGHLQRRHIMRNNINKAATHPRLLEEGFTPFSIDAHDGGFQVHAPQESMVEGRLPKKIESIVKTKKKYLTYLMQSTDWASMTENEHNLIEGLHAAIQGFARHVNVSADVLDQEFARVKGRIEAKFGLFDLKDKRIKQLLLSHSEELFDSEDK